jgi:hypothetical protein
MQRENKIKFRYGEIFYRPCQTPKGYGNKVIKKIMRFSAIQLLVVLTGIKLEELKSFPQLIDRLQQCTSIYRSCCINPPRTIWREKQEMSKNEMVFWLQKLYPM